jgi:[ribosomal protein S18]-alanine N-acetyltransferase
MRSSYGRVQAAVAGKGEAASKLARIRALRPEDIPELVSITEKSSQAASWSRESYEELCTSEGFLSFVSERAGSVSGFVVGRQTADEGEILNVAVRRENRRKGEGQALLSAVLEELHRRGVRRVYLEVRESNETGIAFYQEQGFAKRGRRPGYYREPEEGAVLMEKKLTG